LFRSNTNPEQTALAGYQIAAENGLRRRACQVKPANPGLWSVYPAAGARSAYLKGAFEYRQHAAPGTFSQRLVVYRKIRHTPAMLGGIHFDFSFYTGGVKRGTQDVFAVRFTLVIILGNGNQHLCFHVGNAEVRAVFILGSQSTTVERTASADALGQAGCGTHYNRAAHAV